MAQNFPPFHGKRFRAGFQGNNASRGQRGHLRNAAAGDQNNLQEALVNRVPYLEGLVATNGIVNNQGARSGLHRNGENAYGGSNWRNRNANWQYRDSHHQQNYQQGASRQRCAPQGQAVERQPNPNLGRKNVGPGFKYLESLCELDPENIIIKISTNKNFSISLSQDLTGDYIVVLLKLLSKMCTSSFDACKIEVITLFCKERFIGQVKTFIALLAIHDEKEKRRNQYFWRNPEEFWINLYIMCNSVIELIPSIAIEIIPKLIASAFLSIRNIEVEQRVSVSENIKEDFQKLQEKLLLCTEEIERKRNSEVDKDAIIEIQPPDNFRELSVYPTSMEVLSEERSFIRENKIDRGYQDVEEYLDIQFRLLREDFVGPLRQGIGEYLKQRSGEHKRKKIHTVKVYPKIQFIGAQNVKDQVGIRVQFELDTRKLAKKFDKLENSKRFMYGALVCFTRDNFGTLIFGKIIDRDVKLLEKGMIAVGFDNEDRIEYGVDYIMVECSVYFEPYYQVLKALQNTNVENFPMERYIINVDSQIRHPQYLTDNSNFVIDKINVTLFNPLSWPSAEALKLNNTQYEAFKAGLTNEFCIIQGPPGTGKTYLGLKIAKTLIKNRNIWHNNSPILVVCYTNHALDQFLEGLLNTTTDIIRIGGQSRSDIMKNFNINEKRKVAMKTSKNVNKLLFEKRNYLRVVGKQIGEITAELDSIEAFNSVLDFSCFSCVDHEFAHSWFARAKKQAIEEWLFGGRSAEERENERRKVRMEEMIKKVEKMEMENLNELEDEYSDLEQQDNMEEYRLDYDDLDLFTGVVQTLKHMLKVETLAVELKNKLLELSTFIVTNESTAVERDELEDECFNLQDKLNYLKEMLNMGKRQTWERPFSTNLTHPHTMTAEARWQLYFHWLNLYSNRLKTKLEACGEQFRVVKKQYAEIRDIEDVNLMKRMLVVGMTTTGAARLQVTLQALKCRIVIVEEAAEVLESHIITSLTSHCAQLILIGDHQQLRPSTADYFMETKMKLGISLFERMVRNNLHCSVLGVQHRMRPEISRLIRPAIYPQLIDHESVLAFPPVRGIDHNLYFIHHTHAESDAGDASKQNKHEAGFLVRLARHLILNGYGPEDITILAAYLGQFYMIVREKQKYGNMLKNVRVAVLDNYQGEECKIILLSLVRNNDGGSIGFLKIKNRVCVALSRAKEGMYVMGNIDLLTNNSAIWPKIKDALLEQNSLGEYLTLRCQIHQNYVTKVKKADDFNRCLEGGCDQMCSMILDCGHTCKMMCHIQNRDHQTYRCKQKCGKLLCDNPNHECTKYCYMECGPCLYKVHRVLRCGHDHNIECHIDPIKYECPTPVLTKLDCGHEANKPCYVAIEKFKCPFPCDARLECGHACIRDCHFHDDPDHLEYKCRKNCAKFREGCSLQKQDHICRKLCYEECEPCSIQVIKKRTVCPHVFVVDCYANVDALICEKPCKKPLSCGHICKNKCCEPCGNCEFPTNKVVESCGHTVRVKCNKEPTKKDCRGKCPATLPCGHQCDNRCFEVCTSMCKVLVNSPVQGACGHTIQIPCYLSRLGVKADDLNLLKYCRQECNDVLECTHKCSGTCGECSQGRVHKTCGNKCGAVLVCGHECPIPCRQACQPCTKPCEYRCKHSRCKKKCGEPCSNCMEPCPRACEHKKCNARCGDKCTVDPCTEPCPKTLPCGHGCIGFCGDPCPPLCRVCNRDELEEVFLGFENADDAKWVLLVECGHVIESKGMEGWLSQTGQGSMRIHATVDISATTGMSPLVALVSVILLRIKYRL